VIASEALGADGVVVIGDALVVTLAFVEGDEQQFDLALRQGQRAGLERLPPSADSQPTAVRISRMP